jgi:hypothetical protein
MEEFMTRHAITMAALGLLLCAGTASAQSVEVGAYLGGAPTAGEFAGKTGPAGGGALFGYTGGFDVVVRFETLPGPLSWYSSVGAVTHNIAAIRERTGHVVSGRWLFIPVMTGLRADLSAEAPGPFITAQGGLVLSKAPRLFYPFGAGEESPQLGTTFGFNVGGGFQLTDRLALGVKYHPLGSMEFEYQNANDVLKQDVSFYEVYASVRTPLRRR